MHCVFKETEMLGSFSDVDSSNFSLLNFAGLKKKMYGFHMLILKFSSACSVQSEG